MRRLAVIVLASCVVSAVAGAAEQTAPPPSREAAALFEKYVSLEKRFDPAVADLYSDEAVIKNKRIYPGGQVRELTVPAPRYKELVRAAMPLAKQRGDTNAYSNCTYTPEGSRVRIDCKRFSNLKRYTSPLSLLVGPGKDGWLIFEELSESRP